jgi:hypothetical protein
VHGGFGEKSGAVMAASQQGGVGWPGQQAAGLRVRALSVLGEISPVWVSEGGLEHGNQCDFPGSGKSCNNNNMA